MPSRAKSTGEVDGCSIDAGELAHALQEMLDLRFPPVALAFVSHRPEGIDLFEGEVPSSCAFWRRAEGGVFFASAEAHLNCPIGAVTMGFSMPEQTRQQLLQLVGQMGKIGYVDPVETEYIPWVPGDKSGIVYGPLAEFPFDPQVVLVWVSGHAAMLLDEATGASRWTPPQTGLGTFGRPSCAAVAVAVRRAAPTLSVGCSGMRTFTGIGPDLVLAVLPRAVLDDLTDNLQATVRANAQMSDYYSQQKSRFVSVTT
jgi:uncharacterized protein (DUF169 family)